MKSKERDKNLVEDCIIHCMLALLETIQYLYDASEFIPRSKKWTQDNDHLRERIDWV